MKIHHILALVLISCWLLGCSQQKTTQREPIRSHEKDYARPLAPGQSALRLITDPHRLPDLAQAYDQHDEFTLLAIERSLDWFDAPSSRQYYPFEGITHDQSQASLIAIGELLRQSRSANSFASEIRRLFDVYESVGCDQRGTVLFTGYYAPIFPASQTRTSRFSHPLYYRPDDLVTDPLTGHPEGRRTADGSIVPYYTRQEIETSRMMAGQEIIWLEDALSAYLVHVNGSAKCRIPDSNEYVFIGYAGKTDRPYASLGKAMVEAGLLDGGSVTLAEIKRIARRDPDAVKKLMYRNENFVFFTEYDGGKWPAGSLGVPVTRESSLATDKSIYPRGGLVLVDTETVDFQRRRQPILRFMLDQDTGGAIKAPGRADIFMGIGPSAEILAGGQHAEGRLYYFFLKPQYVRDYLDQ